MSPMVSGWVFTLHGKNPVMICDMILIRYMVRYNADSIIKEKAGKQEWSVKH